jgi:arginase
MRLADGAEAIRGDLPSSATIEVAVPIEAGDALETGIHRFSTLLMVRERHAAVLREVTDWALTIGGDCGVSLAAVDHASQKHPGDVAVVWFDAQPDLHTSDTSPSGAFTGMVLRAITGEGAEGLRLEAENRIPLDRVVLVGARDIDPEEELFMVEQSVTNLLVEDLDTPAALISAVQATGASQVYLHIDLDVLDPSVIVGLPNLAPFGLSLDALTQSITALRASFGLAGATIAGFAPSSPAAAEDDLGSILRVISALTR